MHKQIRPNSTKWVSFERALMDPEGEELTEFLTAAEDYEETTISDADTLVVKPTSASG